MSDVYCCIWAIYGGYTLTRSHVFTEALIRQTDTNHLDKLTKRQNVVMSRDFADMHADSVTQANCMGTVEERSSA